MELVWPAHPYLASYLDALERGWSPDNVRPEAASEELELIRQDPALYVASQSVIRANGGEVVEQFQKPAVYGGAMSFRFRIPLARRFRAKNR
jgi:hypothetical protein